MTIYPRKTQNVLLPVLLVLVLLGYYLLVKTFQPLYAVKAAVKLVLFFGVPISYAALAGDADLLKRLWPKSLTAERLKHLLKMLVAGILIILAVYIAADPLAELFGFANIVEDVVSRTDTDKRLLLLAFLYIPFINGLAEEVFFRGFCFFELTGIWGFMPASIVSAILFSLYHLALINAWFSWPIMLLTLTGLFAAGVILNAIVAKSGDIISAWMLHAMVNIAMLAAIIRFYPE